MCKIKWTCRRGGERRGRGLGGGGEEWGEYMRNRRWGGAGWCNRDGVVRRDEGGGVRGAVNGDYHKLSNYTTRHIEL